MTLSALIRKRDTRNLATAIPAISATQPKTEAATVARIATVAVAKPPKRKEIQPGINDGLELERQLLKAAMCACDFWGDSQTARAEMVADIKATPSNRRQELLEHFLAAYGKAK